MNISKPRRIIEVGTTPDRCVVPQQVKVTDLTSDEMTREEDQLLRESDERAAFNDRLDNFRREF